MIIGWYLIELFAELLNQAIFFATIVLFKFFLNFFYLVLQYILLILEFFYCCLQFLLLASLSFNDLNKTWLTL